MSSPMNNSDEQPPGHPVGKAIPWTPEQIEEMSRTGTPDDDAARRLWKRNCDDGTRTLLDAVLSEMKRLRRSGRDEVTVGEILKRIPRWLRRRFRIDSVFVLGAAERVSTFFRWDAQAQRYRSASSGRFVREESVRRSLLRVVDAVKARMKALAAEVAEGAITIGQWQRRMVPLLKSLHLAAYAAGRGGFGRLTASDYGRIGATLRFQYLRLRAFAEDIEAGRLTAPRIEARAALYASSGYGSYQGGRREAADVAGMTEERRVLGNAEHCDQCIELASRGWVSLGTLPDIGEATPCAANCRCSFRFR